MHCLLSSLCFSPSQYQAVAALESDDFQTPLSPAECVSLVMAYELYRTSESEQKTATFLGWIAQQLNLERRTSACRFAVSSSRCGCSLLEPTQAFVIRTSSHAGF